MRVLVQRVQSSSVTVDGQLVGQIGRGLNLLVGLTATDTLAELTWMARKCLELRLFPDTDCNRWDLSVQEIQGEIQLGQLASISESTVSTSVPPT
jgi:D-tyrosyl-tRNA(Tyr) deacylase